MLGLESLLAWALMGLFGLLSRKKAQRYWSNLAQARMSSLEQVPLVASWLFACIPTFPF